MLKLLKKLGASLIEVTVGAGIAAGLSLVVTEMGRNTAKVSAKSNFDMDVNLITNEIIAILSDPDNCKLTFAGKSAVNTSNGIDSIQIDGSTGTTQKYLADGTSAYGSSKVKISAYQLKEESLTADKALVSENNTNFIIRFLKPNILSSGNQIYMKRIKLWVEVDAQQKIQSCRSLASYSPDLWTRNSTSGNSDHIFYSSGRVSIGSDQPLGALRVGGFAENAYTYVTGNANGVSPAQTVGLAMTWNRSGGNRESLLAYSYDSSVAQANARGSLEMGRLTSGTTYTAELSLMNKKLVLGTSFLSSPTIGNSGSITTTQFHLFKNSNSILSFTPGWKWTTSGWIESDTSANIDISGSGTLQITDHLEVDGNTRVTGNLRIGTAASARGALDVATNGSIYLASDTNVGTTQAIFLPGNLLLAPYNGSNVSYVQARRENDSGSTELQLRTVNSGSVTEAVQIKPNGDVGIGTLIPSAKLHVNGTVQLNSALSASCTATQKGSVRYNDTSGINKMQFCDGSSWKSMRIDEPNEPKFELRYHHLTGSAANVSELVTIKGNGTTNYVVFASVYPTGPGSGGTYDPWEHSAAIQTITITERTATSFRYNLRKSTGDNVNCYIYLLIVYNMELYLLNDGSSTPNNRW